MFVAVAVGMMSLWGNQEAVFPMGAELVGTYPYLMETIMFNTGADVTSREGT